MRRSKEGDQSLIEIAQQKKAELLENGKIGFSYAEASLAFGISYRCLRKMQNVGELLVIEPGDANVAVSLQSSVDGWQRNLWLEMLDTLDRGRSDASAIKRSYEFLYPLAQAVFSGGGQEWAGVTLPKSLERMEPFANFWEQLQSGGIDLRDNSRFLQVLLFALWGNLPEGTQKELASMSMSPQIARNSLGIAELEM